MSGHAACMRLLCSIRQGFHTSACICEMITMHAFDMYRSGPSTKDEKTSARCACCLDSRLYREGHTSGYSRIQIGGCRNGLWTVVCLSIFQGEVPRLCLTPCVFYLYINTHGKASFIPRKPCLSWESLVYLRMCVYVCVCINIYLHTHTHHKYELTYDV
jgi:hypothetical protein